MRNIFSPLHGEPLLGRKTCHLLRPPTLSRLTSEANQLTMRHEEDVRRKFTRPRFLPRSGCASARLDKCAKLEQGGWRGGEKTSTVGNVTTLENGSLQRVFRISSWIGWMINLNPLT